MFFLIIWFKSFVMIKIFHMYQTKVWYSITDFWNRVCCVLCYRHTWGVTYNACPIQYIKMYLYTVTYTKSQHTHTPTQTHTHPHKQPLIPLWQNRVMEVNILRWVCVLWRIVGCKTQLWNPRTVWIYNERRRTNETDEQFSMALGNFE